MNLSLCVSLFLLLATVLACASGEDVDFAALKATLLKMCAANEAGSFGSCCRSNNNGQDIASTDSLPKCFGSIAATTANGAIQKLFVSKACPVLFFLFVFLRIGNRTSYMESRGLTVIPSGAFSGLTSLASLRALSVRGRATPY